MTRSQRKALRIAKIEAYRNAILGIISRVRISGADYSAEIERMKNHSPADVGLILIAEREAFERER